MERTILLITTHPDTLAPLASVIRSLLLQDIMVVHPRNALAIAQKGPCDLVIFDMQSHKDCLPLLKSFKARFTLIPAIAMVPYGDIDMVQQVLENGADDFISQPISLERLKITLRNALRLRSLLLGTASLQLPTYRAEHEAAPGIHLFVDNAGNLKTLQEIEEVLIQYAIASCNGCITQAAQLLGIGRSTLYRRMQGNNHLAGAAHTIHPEKRENMG